MVPRSNFPSGVGFFQTITVFRSTQPHLALKHWEVKATSVKWITSTVIRSSSKKITDLTTLYSPMV
uniref:Uncharacterized protein n=1 Tax=Arion vulgaris TaxID=1028688 RepID=A0A0B7AP96_9EUPU